MSGPDVSNPVRRVAALEAEELVRGGAVILDVREPEETGLGRADGAIEIPLGLLAEHLDELPTTTPIVVVCRTGNRSFVAAEALSEAGFEAVNLEGGMISWQGAGLPVVGDDGEPGIIL